MASISFVKLTKFAHTPMRMTEKSAGLDLCSAYHHCVPANGVAVISTDIGVAIPPDHCGRITGRSGLAVSNGLTVCVGTIDEDYRGNVKIVLQNITNQDYHVMPGDRVAQLICERISYSVPVEVSQLPPTKRNQCGFGSTGRR